MLSYTKIETYDEKVLIEILTFATIFSLKKMQSTAADTPMVKKEGLSC